MYYRTHTKRDVVVTCLLVSVAMLSTVPSLVHGEKKDSRIGTLLGETYDGIKGCQPYIVAGYVPPESPVVADFRVGIIDSGIDANHPQIVSESIVAQADFTGEGINDVLCHGTIVSILSSALNVSSIVPALVIAKVAFEDGTVSYEAVLDAIEWVTTEDVSFVNLSLGFIEGESDYSELCHLIGSKEDVLFVAAAGNFGPDVLVYPASCDVENMLCTGTPESYSGTCGGDAILAPAPDVYVMES